MANVVITGVEAPPRFALHELAYLLAGRDDPRATRSREILGIPTIESPTDQQYRDGLSSLVARGFIEQDQDSILPRNAAGLIGFTLGTAAEWVSILARTTAGTDLVVFVQGERSSVMARIAPALTMDFVPVKPDVPIEAPVSEAVDNLLAEFPDLAIMIRAASESDDSAVFAQRIDGQWTIGFNPVFPGDEDWPAPDLVVSESDETAVREAFTALLKKYRPA